MFKVNIITCLVSLSCTSFVVSSEFSLGGADYDEKKIALDYENKFKRFKTDHHAKTQSAVGNLITASVVVNNLDVISGNNIILLQSAPVNYDGNQKGDRPYMDALCYEHGICGREKNILIALNFYAQAAREGHWCAEFDFKRLIKFCDLNNGGVALPSVS